MARVGEDELTILVETLFGEFFAGWAGGDGKDVEEVEVEGAEAGHEGLEVGGRRGGWRKRGSRGW